MKIRQENFKTIANNYKKGLIERKSEQIAVTGQHIEFMFIIALGLTVYLKYYREYSIVGFQLVMILLIFGYFFIDRVAYNYLSNNMLNSRINNCNFLNNIPACKDLMENILSCKAKMGIDKPLIVYCKKAAYSTHSVPNIYENNGNIILVLQPNMLSMFNQHKSRFNSIIYHELAHICQDDTMIWCSYKINQKLRIFKTSLLFIAFTLTINLLAGLVILFYLFVYYQELKRKVKIFRHTSEVYADYASIGYNENFEIHEVIFDKLFINTKSSDVLHPSSLERYNSVMELIEKTQNIVPPKPTLKGSKGGTGADATALGN